MTGPVGFTTEGDRTPAYRIVDWQGGPNGAFEQVGELPSCSQPGWSTHFL